MITSAINPSTHRYRLGQEKDNHGDGSGALIFLKTVAVGSPNQRGSRTRRIDVAQRQLCASWQSSSTSSGERTAMITRRNAMLGAAVAGLISATPSFAEELPTATRQFDLTREKVELIAPPFVHAHEQATLTAPKIVEFRLVIQETEIVIDDQGTKLQAMTFNGSIPGPMMVVHEGDYVEVTLVNPATNAMPHNVDFHAATGALGGAELTLVNPGEQVTLRWKATRTGTFVYHCAPGGPMIPWQVGSGMNGAVMVLPREGLTDGKG